LRNTVRHDRPREHHFINNALREQHIRAKSV